MGLFGRLFARTSKTTVGTTTPATKVHRATKTPASPIDKPPARLTEDGFGFFPHRAVSGTTTFTKEGAAALFPEGATGMRDVTATVRVEPDNPVKANALALIVNVHKIGYVGNGNWPKDPDGLAVPVRAWCAIQDGEQRVEAHAWVGAGVINWKYGPEQPYAVTRADKIIQSVREKKEVRENVLRSDEEYGHALLVNGKMPFEWVDTIAQLKRDKADDEALALSLACVEAEEAAHQVRPERKPAPAYYEYAAIIYRKQKNLAAEVEIIERYLTLADEQPHPKMVTRLAKATEYLGKQRKAK